LGSAVEDRVRDGIKDGIGDGIKDGIRDGIEDRIRDRIKSASVDVGGFDTASSVTGGTFESNISLVDPTIQFSRTKK